MAKRKGYLIWLITFTLAVITINIKQIFYFGLLLYMISILLIFKFNKIVINKKLTINPIKLFVIIFVIFSPKLILYLSRYVIELFGIGHFDLTLFWMVSWSSLSSIFLLIVWENTTGYEKEIKCHKIST